MTQQIQAPQRFATGEQMHRLMAELYPICRSLTGDGVRKTLEIVARNIPLEIHEVRSGTRAFDWTVPREWNIHDAYIRNPQGDTVVDFRKHNLHVTSYSVPVRRRMALAELRPHLFTSDAHPDWIPYRTSYYSENWGFCLAQRVYDSLEEGEYEVVIDSELKDGSLTYGEFFLRGEESNEIFLSTHVCHPSMANDNLSGIALATTLAGEAEAAGYRHSLRIVFVPGCLGAIAWLAANPNCGDRVRHGLVLTGAGDGGPFTYKRSRRGDAVVDRAAEHVLRRAGMPYNIVDFTPYGYDERQYCSPGFDLPVGCFSRTPYGKYPQYHTSGDDLEFVRPEYLEQSLKVCRTILDVVDRDAQWLNLSPYGEPQLGKRGLYRGTGGPEPQARDMARLWILSSSDGKHSAMDIAERAGMPFEVIAEAAEELCAAGLLRRMSDPLSRADTRK